jgi:hypothetical protein
MINYTPRRIDTITNDKLNLRFGLIGFISLNSSVLSFDLCVLKSVFNNLFSIKTLQIQFYNLQRKKQDEQNQDTDPSQLENKEDKPVFFAQLVEDFVNGFDAVLFSKNFKIPI